MGTSGIGKTQLIRMYAYKNNYDLIWFFDCNLDLNEQFVKLAKQLNTIKQTNISEEVALAKKEVISYLTTTNKWLLVFDNLKVNENKKVYLENIIAKLPKPKGAISGYLWRRGQTIPENLEFFLKNSEKYNINLYAMLKLRSELLSLYIKTYAMLSQILLKTLTRSHIITVKNFDNIPVLS